MVSSGTYNFALSNASIVLEAFDRIQKRPGEVDRHMMISARTSLQLELQTWSNKGFNFWELLSGTINIAVNTPTYILPSQLVTLTEMYYTTVVPGGVNSDRIMVPIQREQYAMIVNKLQPGIPTQYWFQMLITPQVTIWEVPASGQVAPNYVINWYGLSQIQDANLGGGDTPNIDYRCYEALTAGMALRLAEKFGPVDPNAKLAMMKEKKGLFDIAWGDMVRRDQEPGMISYRPRVGGYGRM